MTRALGAVLFWLAVYLLAGCAHKFNRTTSDRGKAEDTTRWQTAATDERNERKTETASSNRKLTGKARVTKPDGTTIDVSWVDEAVALYTATGENQARSKSTAAGEQQRKNEHDKGTKTGSSVSWWPPWWLILLALGLVAAYLFYLRWRARRLRLL